MSYETHRESAVDEFADELVVLAGDYPELVVLGFVGAISSLVSGLLYAAPIIWILVVTGVATCRRLTSRYPQWFLPFSPIASWYGNVERRRQERRDHRMFLDAFTQCGLLAPSGGLQVESIRRTPPGCEVDVELPPGMDPALLQGAGPALAATLHVQGVTVLPARSAGHWTLAVRTTETLAPGQSAQATWPLIPALFAGRTVDAYRDNIPLALDENGRQVTGRLFETGYLLGGEPGSGKSVASQLLISALAADPGCVLVGIDLKAGLELRAWRDRLDSFARTPDEALVSLNAVAAEMHRRLRWLYDETDHRKVPHGTPLLGLVIDECAQLTGESAPKELRDAANAVLTQIVQLGRAAGVVVVICTQKPSAASISSSVRDLISTRWCLRVVSRPAAEAVLGPLPQDATRLPWQIPTAWRGVGLIRDDEGTVRVCRSYYLDEPTVDRLAELAALHRMAALAQGAWTLAVPPPGPGPGPGPDNPPRRRRRPGK